MTVTIFTATRPPSVALILGHEGGMLRVALCHYDRTTATLEKEPVVRMEGTMLNYTGKLVALGFAFVFFPSSIF